MVTVGREPREHEGAASVGGLAYLSALASNTPSAANIRRYAEIVRDRAILRSLAEVGTGDRRLGLQHRWARTRTQLLDEAESKVFEIAEQGARGQQGFQDMPPLLTQVVERIDMLYNRDNPTATSPACRPASSIWIA